MAETTNTTTISTKPEPTSQISLEDSSLTSGDDKNISYNRFALTSDFKNQICQQIADSTDSLPQWGLQDRNGHKGSNASLTSTESISQGNLVPDTSTDKTPMPKDNPMDSIGQTASRTSTRQLSTVDSARTAKITDHGDKRPGTLRRFTTKIKQSISQGQK